MPARLTLNGQDLVNFSSNNYLGLTHHPDVIAAAHAALDLWGAGSGASRLITGDLEVHRDLERELALFKKEQDTIVFSSGYLANLGAVSAFLSEKDLVLVDRFNHASLIDAAKLSKAKLWVYPHKDMEELRRLLLKASGFGKKLVITDAYFSMDGDLAPLPDLVRICKETDSYLLVDEAHSMGVFGDTGAGLTEYFGLQGKIDFVMGTLSKMLGSVGGYVCGSQAMKNYLVNRARQFIYTTAPSPVASAAALAAVRVLRANPSLRQTLWKNTTRLRAALADMGFDLMGSEGPIIPVKMKNTAAAVRAQDYLRSKGHCVVAIRPPTVPKHTDRLRISVSAAHSEEDVESLIRALKGLSS